MIILPYAEDIRELNGILESAGFNLDNENEVNVIENLSKKEKDVAKLLVKNLSIEFNSRNFENPSL